jgi:hypothetical protein
MTQPTTPTVAAWQRHLNCGPAEAAEHVRYLVADLLIAQEVPLDPQYGGQGWEPKTLCSPVVALPQYGSGARVVELHNGNFDIQFTPMYVEGTFDDEGWGGVEAWNATDPEGPCQTEGFKSSNDAVSRLIELLTGHACWPEL